jgi:tRNA U34 5-methylaminomethyl-2-thiouridine-forming methyltransferase MnmC
LEFLAGLARRLSPEGRLISYSSAAAYRASLRSLGLQLAAIRHPPGTVKRWSGGTVASPAHLRANGVLRPLTPMEEEHLLTRAAEPYRDPSGTATASQILAERARHQEASSAASTSAWRHRWGLG